MKDKNSTREQNPTSPPLSEKSVVADKLSQPTSEQLTSEEYLDEKEIDLNELFPGAETDLNDLFPDAAVKHLLKKITKNKKDMSVIKERLTAENEIPQEGKEDELINIDSSKAHKTEAGRTD